MLIQHQHMEMKSFKVFPLAHLLLSLKSVKNTCDERGVTHIIRSRTRDYSKCQNKIEDFCLILFFKKCILVYLSRFGANLGKNFFKEFWWEKQI